jgi:hypothetical protein
MYPIFSVAFIIRNLIFDLKKKENFYIEYAI